MTNFDQPEDPSSVSSEIILLFENVLAGKNVNDCNLAEQDIEDVISLIRAPECLKLLSDLNEKLISAKGTINVDTDENIKETFLPSLQNFLNTLPDNDARTNMTSGARIGLRVIRELAIKSFKGVSKFPDLMSLNKEDSLNLVNGMLQEFLPILPDRTCGACQAICEYTGEWDPYLAGDFAHLFITSAKSDVLFETRIAGLIRNDQAFNQYWQPLNRYALMRSQTSR